MSARTATAPTVACSLGSHVSTPVVAVSAAAHVGLRLVTMQAHPGERDSCRLVAGTGQRGGSSSMGNPASFQAEKPPSMCTTSSRPMSLRAAVARAERQALPQ